MAVQQDSFYFRQKRIMPVDVGPACLYHANSWVGELVNGTQNKIFRRHKVRVEDRDEFALGSFQPFCQCTRLESFAIATV